MDGLWDIQYATMFSPCIKTLERAITRGNLISWTVENLHSSKLMKTTLATEKGHLDQECKYLYSIKVDNIILDNFPAKNTEQDNNIFAKIFDPLDDSPNTKQKAHIYLTGYFPHKSSRGNTYIFLMYGYKIDSILIEPLNTR